MDPRERQEGRYDRRCSWKGWAAFAVVGAIAFGTGAAAAPPVTLLSRADPGVVSDTGGGFSTTAPPAALSADGRYVVFSSGASNLVPGQVDPNQGSDIFLFDRTTGVRTLVSHTAGAPATAGNEISDNPSISADGRYVVYVSQATDLVAGQVDTPVTPDIFLYDRTTGTNLLLSHAGGSPATAAAGRSLSPVVSDDGSFVAYQSEATDLVAGQSGSGTGVFLYDRGAGTTVLVSHATASATALASGDSATPALSGDGRYLAFVSNATNLVAGQTGGAPLANVFLYDRLAGTSVLLSHASGAPAAVGNSLSYQAVVSDDGGTVTFFSMASDLLVGGSNPAGGVFAYDRASGAVTLISRAAGSTTAAADDISYAPSLSADGRYVAFLSQGTNLVSGEIDANGSGADVFLFDRTGGTVTLVSHKNTAAGTTGSAASAFPVLSADGRYVAYQSLATDLSPGQFDHASLFDVFLYDRVTATSTLVSSAFDTPNGPAGGSSALPAISADGAWVAFTSDAFDVAFVHDLNQQQDVFLYSRAGQANTLVSRRDPSLPSLSAMAGSFLGNMSADGRLVAFESRAGNLSPDESSNLAHGDDIFLADTTTGAITLVSHQAASPTATGDGNNSFPRISLDGSQVVYVSEAQNLVAGQSDTIFTPDVFLWDRASGANVLVSHHAGTPNQAANGGSSEAVVSSDGRFVAYTSVATDLVSGASDANGRQDVFLYDRTTGQSTLVSHAAGLATTANGLSYLPTLSADGRYVVYQSSATNLVAGATTSGMDDNVYLYDRLTGANTLVSHAAGAPLTGAQGSGSTISADGRFVLYSSLATTLVAGQVDTNNLFDTFVWDRLADSTSLVSHANGASTTAANSGSNAISLSADGHFLLWSSFASDLLPGQTHADGSDLVLSDRLTGAVTLVSHADGSAAAGVGFDSAVISADGAYVAFSSRAPHLVPGQIDGTLTSDVFLYDRAAGTTELLSRIPASPLATGGGNSVLPAISADGSSIAFMSGAPDLVAGDYNGESDIFLSVHPLPGSAFFTLTPCRLLDSRLAPPSLTSGVTATATAHGACGIPGTARALAVNVTVLQATGAGHLTFYPAGTGSPMASTINFPAGRTRSNNTIVRLSLDGLGDLSISPFVAGGGTAQVIVDVVGYFE